MDTIKMLRAKYLEYAKLLGDIEFQIFTLSRKRDEIRHLMSSLDGIAPEMQAIEQAQLQNLQKKGQEPNGKA